MPKIDKSTLKILPRTNIQIYKLVNGKNYYCKFYVGSGFKNIKSKRFEKCLNTANIKDAEKYSKAHWKTWIQNNPSTINEDIKDFDLDIAQSFLEFKIKKYKHKTHLKNNEQGQRDKAKWNNYLKPFFEDVDYSDIELIENIINDEVLSKLKDDGKSGNTINKYLSIIVQMFKRAQKKGIVNYVPDIPTQQVIDTPRLPYTNEELNLINVRCREINDDYHIQAKDYFNLLRCAGFRPGLEPLNLKRKDCRIVKEVNGTELVFDVWGTKTEPLHRPIANKWFLEHVWTEIWNRNPNTKENDFLLFPTYRDRTKLKNKLHKTFVEISKKLNLFHVNGGTRPPYSIRHTYATDQYSNGTSIEDIAKLMNTSPRMVRDVYLAHTDVAVIALANRRGKSRLKIIK